MISGLPAALARRWRLTVLGLLLTVVFLAGAYVAVPPQYTAKAAVLLVPPSDSVGNNPYLNLSSLQGLNNVLAQGLTDTSTSDALAAKGLSTNYTITSDAASSGPIVIINGTAKTRDGALAVVNELLGRLPATLKQLQQTAGVVADKSYVTSTVLNPPNAPVAVRKNQTRAVIAAGAAGLVLTFLMIAGAERVGNRRRAKAAAAAEQESGAAQNPTPMALDKLVPIPAGTRNGAAVSGVAANGAGTNGAGTNGAGTNGAGTNGAAASAAGGKERLASTGANSGELVNGRRRPAQDSPAVVSKRQRIRRPSGR